MTSGMAASARYTGPKRRQCDPRRLSAFQYVYCARLVRAASVMAKLMLCESDFAPADAVTPSIPASRSGQHQLPTTARNTSCQRYVSLITRYYTNHTVK